MKVDGVVVWYKPSEENIQNIKSYLNYLNKLYIVDNSDDENIERLKLEKRLMEKIKYIPLNENKGIAYALNLGIKESVKNKSDYLITLDQDSSFLEENMLLKYFEMIDNDKDKSEVALYGVSTTAENSFSLKENEFSEVKVLISSGMMINLKLIDKIGYFKEEFFIDEVDTEYCYRVLKNGKKIKKANNICLKHKIGESKIYKIFGKKITKVTHHNYIRRYYMIRNKLYMIKMFPEEKKAYKRRIRREIKNIILFEKDKILKLKMCLLAYKDFKNKIMGKIPKEYMKK